MSQQELNSGNKLDQSDEDETFDNENQIFQVELNETNKQNQENNNEYIQVQGGQSNINQQNTEQQRNQLIQNIISIFQHHLWHKFGGLMLLLISYYFFTTHISATCSREQNPVPEDCIDLVLASLSTWVYSIFISATTIVLTFYLAIYNKIHRVYIFGSLGLFIYLNYIKYGSIDITLINLRNFQPGHQIGLYVIVVVQAVSLILYKLLKQLYKKSKISLIGLVLFVLIFGFIKYNQALQSCNGWDKGFIDEIDHSEQYCKLKRPTLCWPVILGDFLNLGPDTCNIKQKDQDNYRIQTLKNYGVINEQHNEQEQQELLQKTKFIGWPIINIYNDLVHTTEQEVTKNIIKDSKVYNDTIKFEDTQHEVIVDIENLDLKIQVKRNQQIVDLTQKKQKTTQSMAKNMIMIYLDTVSRAQFFRKLPKTVEFLKKYANYNSQEYQDSSAEAKVFDYFRFHAIDRRTQDNVFKLRYNIFTDDWKKQYVEMDSEKKIQSIFNNIKEAGYVFGHATNSMSIKSNLRYHKYNYNPLYTYFEGDKADHEMYLFDPNYVFQSNQFGISKGANSIYRRCIYGKDTNYYVLDYGKKFLDAYNDDKKFLLLEFTDGHELTSEVVQYLDENLFNFLANLEQKGQMQSETMIYFMSDHGQHLISNYQLLDLLLPEEQRGKDIYTIERMLPFFFLSVSNDILRKNQQLQNIFETNSQRIFGMIEVRNSMLTTAYGLENEDMSEFIRKQNIFNEMPIDSSCLDIGLANMPNPFEYCSCMPQEGYFNVLEKRKTRNEVYNTPQILPYEGQFEIFRVDHSKPKKLNNDGENIN